MKKNIKTLLISILTITALSACNPYTFSTKEHRQVTKNISLDQLGQTDCVDDIDIYITRDSDAYIWSCDTLNGSESGLYLTNDYHNGYSFAASYNAETEDLTVDVYSFIMESIFSSKEEMEIKVFPAAISAMKRIQRSINKYKAKDEAKEKLDNSFS